MSAVVVIDVARIESLHKLATESAGNAVEYAIACGRELIAVKASLGHGNFGRWCEQLSFSHETRAAYMRAARAPQISSASEISSIRGLLSELKQQRKAERRETIVDYAEQASNKTADLGALSSRGMKFGTVYADPPWLYGNQGTRGSTGDHYVGLSVDEICELPVAQLVADNAHLHLWTTNAFLFEAKRVIEAWGFEYRSCYVWVKPQMGMGNYWRVSHEFLLFGIKGKAPFADRSLMSWGEFPRGKHSAKPEPIRALIEKASAGPYLEMFARRPVRGWTVWGNEVASDVLDESEELIA
jgi:N6-adenosine-specific RNA methylase IME4